MRPTPHFVRVARALALGGALAARLNGCSAFPPPACNCPTDANLPNDLGAAHELLDGVCTAAELDAGCNNATYPGGPLLPPELAA